MAIYKCTFFRIINQLLSKISAEIFYFKLTLFTLFFNSMCLNKQKSKILFDPILYNFFSIAKQLGPIFVVLAVMLTSSVVVIFYICLLPHKFNQSYFWTVYHLIFGHWLLSNIVFNYFKAAFTSPGYPSSNFDGSSNICRKCFIKKPNRTHHCAICQRCILKMDHHCPWINNCVGHLNHRYFFLFLVYMSIGCIYVSISAYPLFIKHFYGDEDVGWLGVFYLFYLIKRIFYPLNNRFYSHTETYEQSTFSLHNLIVFEFMLCSTVVIAVSGLTLWNMRLISKGETSIELAINRQEKRRLSELNKIYKNPYDLGFKKNWQLFLGLNHNRSFWRYVLLPSSHTPIEDGIIWETIYNLHKPNSDLNSLLIV